MLSSCPPAGRSSSEARLGVVLFIGRGPPRPGIRPHLLTENVGAPFDSVYSEPCCLKTSASAEVFVVLGLLKMIVGNSFT